MDSNQTRIIKDPNSMLIRDIGYKFHKNDLGNIRLEYFKTIYLKDLLYAFDEEPFEYQEKCINTLPDNWDKLPEGYYDFYNLNLDISMNLLKWGKYGKGREIIPITVGVLIIRQDEAWNLNWDDLNIIEDFCYFPHSKDTYLKFYTSKVHGVVPTSYLGGSDIEKKEAFELYGSGLIEHNENKLYSCRFKTIGRDLEGPTEQYVIGITLRREDSKQISAIYIFDTGGMLSE